MKQMTIGQYRHRSDADGHLDIIRRLMPNAKFVVMFNPSLSSEHYLTPLKHLFPKAQRTSPRYG
jgi:hypothetical protein